MVIRYGINSKELYNIFADYDIIATSSIFTIQTRMHFEIAKLQKFLKIVERKFWLYLVV